MISTRSVVLSAASFAALAQALTVNTPASAVQCQPVQLSWSDGTAPFYVSIIPGGEPSAAALENLPDQTGTTYTWTVDIDSGTAITVKVVDSTGEINYSDQITIQEGTTTTCSSSSSSSSSGSSAAAGSAAAGSSASSASSSASSSSSKSSSSAALASGRSSTTTGSTKAASTTTSGTGVAAAAAATTSSSSTGSASSGAKVGMGLLGGALLFALAA